MGITVYDVLDELRASATSEAEKGSRLERLVKSYLRTDPVYAEQFSDVWLWNEWPGRAGKHDTGIDLVAQNHVTGGFVAIQCKFFAPTSTIQKPDIDSFLSASGKEGFTERIIVSTTDKWNAHAEDAIKAQQIPVRRIGLSDFEASPIDWSYFSLETPEVLVTVGKKTARPHQEAAIEAASTGFVEHDRGKLIMACGTGKTFASLCLAERMFGAGGSVLFLVPSISLLSQTLREWCVEASVPLLPLAVCSDRKSTARSRNTNEDISTVDLALPATTNVTLFQSRLAQAQARSDAMTVVFATYQSISVVAQAQASGEMRDFDLIICDEAHRTTGVTLAGEDESAFVRVHNAEYIRGGKRLYMTATPRIYDDASKAKAGEADALLASMDNEEIYGPEFYRLGFGEAVARDLLTDYKVLVLAVDETAVAKTFQVQLSENGELKLDDAAKIVGCWNGLAKKGNAEHSFAVDPLPMRRAVAFAGTIQASRKIEALFSSIVDQYVATHELDEHGEADSVLQCEVRHVDGTFNSLERNSRLDWLKAEVQEGQCRILTNARCLSEGVDVPALDSVMFLSPRKSVVDVVQSVGRVMRKAPGKKYGYIILPVGIPEGVTPEQALRDNTKYAAVWEVLQALRAHDERFDAMVNRIDLTRRRDDKINVIGVASGGGERDTEALHGTQQTLTLSLANLDEWRDAVYAKIVAKVGSRRYWEDWANDVAKIAERHITRITALLDDNRTTVSQEFETFLDGLRANLNESITRTDAIEMLAQHLITRPVFDALFGGYDFAAHNPVAQTMERMLAVLDEHALDSENESLEKFYDSVRMRVQGIDSAEGRQRIVVELYDKFFATAFKRTVNKLGIVYTPVEIVNFILNSADHVLRAEFGQGLTDANVHILDGFTGTGTFMVRLIQSGLIRPQDLARKYANELHANEILLLAYYIAAVNIETAYQDVMTGHVGSQDYQPFPGLVLTDTIQAWEDYDRPDLGVFTENNERLERLKALPITVIVGNPPYSVGQESANDDNANESYPSLDSSIREAYAATSSAKSTRTLYDPYIRAIRWASLRIADRGIIAYVTNGAFIDSNTTDGMRKSLAQDFSAIYIFNLRGNQRTAGEQSRREGGKIFGGGSRASVAITLLVKNPARGSGVVIHYSDIGDYLSREQKLAKIRKAVGITGLEFAAITPNEQGDWLNQRRSDFGSFIPIASRDEHPTVFGSYSLGFGTNRDAWVYNYNRDTIALVMRKATATYAGCLAGKRTNNPALIKWSSSLEARFERGEELPYSDVIPTPVVYRPFERVLAYSDLRWIHRPGMVRAAFPVPAASNMGIVVIAPRPEATPTAMMVDAMPDLSFYTYGGQFLPRWRYERVQDSGMLDIPLGDSIAVEGYQKFDNITAEALTLFKDVYGSINTDDIFSYVYGILHSPEYRNTYAADLRKTLPRIPLVENPWPFIEVGKALTDLHLGYESAAPYPLDGLSTQPVGDPYDFFRVEKLTFAKVRRDGKLIADRSAIKYNSRITLSGIPEDAHRYMLGSRSAIEWVIDRYQVKTDKPSGIVNDPNDWSREVGDPRYIIDLVARVVTVSIETVKMVDSLPALAIIAQK